ncbi:hypothetical protein RF11_07939 [Thelohanellus kitauei]|uniref:Integrase catalytic domain-containing protein n=1 Tax=Thelohanellus kitauei TaxID=669202 RepID=A0A0C2MN19_THEKT|nr:hypothetical protein RF11_07939 [Thelohanellus kitauei]
MRSANILNIYNFIIEYSTSIENGNADALSRLPSGPDHAFDRKEGLDDFDRVYTIRSISIQISPTKPEVLRDSTDKDNVLDEVMSYVRRGWPNKINDYLKCYWRVKNDLSRENDRLLYKNRLVIHGEIKKEILGILHQLAPTCVYRPNIDADIEAMSTSCTRCAEYQNTFPKAENHPWDYQKEVRQRLHIDHAINFLGSNWLIIVDAFSKYLNIHRTSSISFEATIKLLELDLSLFGYPIQVISDNEFRNWCKETGIHHVTGAPYHSATNGQAQRLILYIKRSMQKSTTS